MTHASIAVVGPGAVGGAVAAALADAGHGVRLCARQPFDALEVLGPDGPRRHELPVQTDPDTVDPVPWVVVAVKAHQTDGAAPWLQALTGPDTRVVVAQNGVEHDAVVRPHVGDARVVPVAVLLSAVKVGPGRIEQSVPGWLTVADDDDGRAFAALFSDGDRGAVRVRLTEDFAAATWRKLMVNAASGAVCAVTLRSNEVWLEPDVARLGLALMHEVVDVARAAGVDLDPAEADAALQRMRTNPSGNWPSIARDRREGRAMEWQARNQVVGRVGRRVGVATPLNDVMTTLLAAVRPD